jgi:hypothetical protein
MLLSMLEGMLKGLAAAMEGTMGLPTVPVN